MKDVLIVGAGPSGLSLALFLKAHGISSTIIDKKKKISHYSKALGINPKTLGLLKSVGLLADFMEAGYLMNAMNLRKEDKLVHKIRFDKARTEFPFMLVLPQSQSEAILLQACLSKNINVFLDSELSSFEITNDKVGVNIKSEYSFAPEYDIIIGADGIHSKVRQLSNIEFKGYSFQNVWKLFDVELKTSLNPDEGNIIAFREGAMILLRVKDNIWRVAGSRDNILEYLPKSSQVRKVIWESDFIIHQKLAAQLSSQNCALIGDAAHVHSPLGARGMNLGIEDAYVLAQCIAENKLTDYHNLRFKYLKKVINRIGWMTKTMAGSSGMSRMLRSIMPGLGFLMPMVTPGIRDFVMNVD